MIPQLERVYLVQWKVALSSSSVHCLTESLSAYEFRARHVFGQMYVDSLFPCIKSSMIKVTLELG